MNTDQDVIKFFDKLKEYKGIGATAKMIRTPVDIETWINEEYYSGPSSRQIYPYWRNAIIKVFNSPVRINTVVITGSIGGGKALLNTQTIPTPNGDKTIEALSVGDYIFGSNGKPVKVIGVFPQGKRPLYKLTFKDDSYIVCDDQHLWTIKHSNHKHKDKILSTKDLYDLFINDNTSRGRLNDWEIPIVKPLEYKEKDFKIHPYILGSLLADGSLTANNKICWTKGETLVVEEFSKYVNIKNYKANPIRYYISQIDNPNFLDSIKSLGLMGKNSRNKFIPKDYFYGSIEQRKELLYGLMDGDGSPTHYGREVSGYMYSTTSKELADDVYRLVASLGGLARIIEVPGRLSRKEEPTIYEVHIETSFNPFKVCSWKDHWEVSNLKRKQRGLTRRIKRVEKLNEEEECTCIKVDSPDELFVADTKYNIVTHNTTAATYMLAYKIYELSCYFPPQALFSLMNDSKILFAYFNITKDIASQVGFGQLRDLIDSIPYFQNVFKRNDKINSMLEWKESKMYVKSASSPNDVLGMNLIAFFMDEANFFKGDGTDNTGGSINDIKSKARALYNSVKARGKSRFVVNNEDFTFSIIVSSSMYESSFTEEIIKESQGEKNVMVFDAKLWDVKNTENYSKERFVVFSGNELIDPIVCKTVTDINYIREYYKLPKSTKTTPNEAIQDIQDYDIRKRFIEIPENFRKEFEGNIIQALQDIAGVPVSALGKLFSNRDAYARALTDEESPFMQDQIVISTGANTTIQDYFKPGWKPKDPSKKRFLHIDQSISGDSTGAAQCYVDSVEYDSAGLPILKIAFDWMIRINPPKPPHQIDLAKVRSIIPWQEEHFGITYGMISYDTFQSYSSVQDLDKSGYNVKFRSVEKDKPYLDLCDLYYQGRIKHYRNEWYEKELFNLNWYRAQGKVDHPPAKDGGCFTGDTLIKTLNGNISFEDLYNMKVKEIYVWGCREDGTIIPTLARNCRITKYVNKLCIVSLDNGESIKCTPNHLFMCRDGSYIEAENLNIGDSLMPLYTSYSGNYELVKNNKTNNYEFSHLYVYKYFNKNYDPNKVVHHKDYNYINNVPENLIQLTRREHIKEHIKSLCDLSAEARSTEDFKNRVRVQKLKYYWGRDYSIYDVSFTKKPRPIFDKEAYQKSRNWYLVKKRAKERELNKKWHSITEYNRSEQAREISRSNAKKLNEGYWKQPQNKLKQKTVGKANLRKALDIRINREDAVWIEKVKNSGIDISRLSVTEICKVFKGSKNANKRRLAKLQGTWNHKVKSVSTINLDMPIPVYDITVPETNNFALAAGVFVHNSKDLSDAVCGSVADALESEEIYNMQRANDLDYFLIDQDNNVDNSYNLLNGFK